MSKTSFAWKLCGEVVDIKKGDLKNSKNLNELLTTYDITRSKPGAGTPTDNGAMEAINGWVKDELFSDFSIGESEDAEGSVRAYTSYFNERRPACALGHLSQSSSLRSSMAALAARKGREKRNGGKGAANSQGWTVKAKKGRGLSTFS